MPSAEPYRPPASAVEAPPPARAPQRDSWIVRGAFALGLCIAVTVAFLPQREGQSAEDWVALRVGAAGAALACLGLLVPWGRLGRLGRALHPPPRQLAAASRVLGWVALGALPLVALRAPWWANPLVALLPFAALALWRRRPWAVWIWYALGAAALVGGLWRFAGGVLALVGADGTPLGARGGSLTGGLVLIALGFFVARDTRAFQRGLRQP